MPDKISDSELLLQLRQDADTARQNFERAKDEFDNAHSVAYALGRSSLEGPPDSLLRRYNEAADAYGNAIRRFAEIAHDLRLLDKMPELD